VKNDKIQTINTVNRKSITQVWFLRECLKSTSEKRYEGSTAYQSDKEKVRINFVKSVSLCNCNYDWIITSTTVSTLQG
jgi:hypothetical protein